RAGFTPRRARASPPWARFRAATRSVPASRSTAFTPRRISRPRSRSDPRWSGDRGSGGSPRCPRGPAFPTGWSTGCRRAAAWRPCPSATATDSPGRSGAAVVSSSAGLPPQTRTDRSPSPSASATSPASTAPGASVAPLASDMSASLLSKSLPEADIFDLTRRMRGRDGQPAAQFQPVRTTPLVENVGTQVPFWTYDFAAKKPIRITATLRVVTDHAKWWVQNDVQVDVDQLGASASSFENKVYPTDRRLYGSEWSPGVDSD